MSAEGNVRVAFGEALHRDWIAGNAEGYDPNLAESDAKHLDIHLGWYDEDKPFPQLVLTETSSQAQGENGYVGWKADGSGHIQEFDGRIDAVVFAGAPSDLPENPGLLADRIASEVRRIAHHNSDGLADPVTGAWLVDRLSALSRPQGGVDTEFAETRYESRVELGYGLFEQPP